MLLRLPLRCFIRLLRLPAVDLRDHDGPAITAATLAAARDRVPHRPSPRVPCGAAAIGAPHPEIDDRFIITKRLIAMVAKFRMYPRHIEIGHIPFGFYVRIMCIR